MLDKNQRIIVESIKSAKRLKISMGGVNMRMTGPRW